MRLHFLQAGPADAPAICFLHGGAAHAHWFDRVLPAFADRFHVISLDQRGHGESDWAAPPAYTTEDFAGDLLALMDRLGWARMTLVGHSMGGHNSMGFSAWHPDRTAALVIVDARPSLPAASVDRMHARGRRPPRLHASEATALASFRLLPPDTVADPALLAHIAKMGLARVNGGFRYRFDPACYGHRGPVDCWPLLPRITAPTLVVRAERSPILPADMAARMTKAIPRSEVVEIPGAYHHLTLDAPEAFAATLDAFLRRAL
ncbi:MAG TPA: alpha/beta hydrolase [Methylomirabilota bacterium]|nr:alpha/beta hydrolase [Methylomirabilota bacterium]